MPNPPAAVADQAYAYYRQGVNYFSKIHPSGLYRNVTVESLFAGFDAVEYEERLRRLKEMLAAFDVARHFFSRVVSEFPRSEWAYDSRAKLDLLAALRRRYERMIDAGH